MKRLLQPYVSKDLNRKIVLLSGPRQVGKTTLARSLSFDFQYLNYDNDEHRVILAKKMWDRQKDLLILDEVHKKPNWKRWIKGIYDTEGLHPKLLVTGSARLDIVRKMGDSLAGRFFQFRLHPFDLKELKSVWSSSSDENALGRWDEVGVFERLLKVGGFPEPFLAQDENFYSRWRKSHTDIILRQDLLDLESVRNITGIETLIQLLRSRVGSTVSFSSLARDLEVDPKTVKRWITILENLYVIFRINPFSKNVARSLLKEPKYYFYDTGQVNGDLGAKLENLIACALLKELHYLEDIKGAETGLFYLKNKEQREIDFLVIVNQTPKFLLEVKWGNDSFSSNFERFEKFFPGVKQIQLVGDIRDEKTFPARNGMIREVRRASNWLSAFQIDD